MHRRFTKGFVLLKDITSKKTEAMITAGGGKVTKQILLGGAGKSMERFNGNYFMPLVEQGCGKWEKTITTA